MKKNTLLASLIIGINIFLYHSYKNESETSATEDIVQLSNYLTSKTNSVDTLHRDPFGAVQYSTFKQVSRSPKIQKKRTPLPRIKVQTIFLGGNPVAQIQINGKSRMVKVGDTILKIKILNIIKDGIKIEFEGETHFIPQ